MAMSPSASLLPSISSLTRSNAISLELPALGDMLPMFKSFFFLDLGGVVGGFDALPSDADSVLFLVFPFDDSAAFDPPSVALALVARSYALVVLVDGGALDLARGPSIAATHQLNPSTPSI